MNLVWVLFRAHHHNSLLLHCFCPHLGVRKNQMSGISVEKNNPPLGWYRGRNLQFRRRMQSPLGPCPHLAMLVLLPQKAHSPSEGAEMDGSSSVTQKKYFSLVK